MESINEDLTTFEEKRVEIGKAVSYTEFRRRLAFKLKVPIHIAKKIHDGYEEVIKDALSHGEGIRFQEIGTFVFNPFANPIDNSNHRVKRLTALRFNLTKSKAFRKSRDIASNAYLKSIGASVEPTDD